MSNSLRTPEVKHNFRAIIRERLTCDRLPAMIDWYGYEIWRGEDELYWYDSQPHPNDPTLQSTHPILFSVNRFVRNYNTG
jgi:hypothetical protein